MTIHHPDHAPYRQFTTRQRVDKAAQTLQGMIHGITIDGELNSEEVAELMNWGREYADLLGKAPFNEVKEKLDEILADGRVTMEEAAGLQGWLDDLAPQPGGMRLSHPLPQTPFPRLPLRRGRHRAHRMGTPRGMRLPLHHPLDRQQIRRRPQTPTLPAA